MLRPRGPSSFAIWRRAVLLVRRSGSLLPFHVVDRWVVLGSVDSDITLVTRPHFGSRRASVAIFFFFSAAVDDHFKFQFAFPRRRRRRRTWQRIKYYNDAPKEHLEYCSADTRQVKLFVGRLPTSNRQTGRHH
jgi:hypothetical protein